MISFTSKPNFRYFAETITNIIFSNVLISCDQHVYKKNVVDMKDAV